MELSAFNNKFKDPEKIFKYVDFQTGMIILQNQKLKFTNPKDFNDPFDCNMDGVVFSLSGSIDDSIKRDIAILKGLFDPKYLDNEILQKGFEHSESDKINKCGVTCFSLDGKNDLMWAHYADKHKGMRLEFRNASVSSKIKGVRIDIEGFVEYGVTGIVNYCESKLVGLYRIFLTKAKNWSYEKEYRMLTLKGAGLYEFDPKWLTKITFGIRADPEQIEKIIRLCKGNELSHVKFEIAKNHNSSIVYEAINRN